jgi:YidC/Oxa1 family membrane protein insertase
VFDFVLSPAYDLLTALTGLTGATLAIILFTVGVRLLLLPLGLRQACRSGFSAFPAVEARSGSS